MLPAFECILLACVCQSSIQLLLSECLPQSDSVDGVWMPGHDGKALGIITVGAQQGEYLIAGVSQDQIALHSATMVCRWLTTA